MGIPKMWPALGKNGSRAVKTGVEKIALGDSGVAIELSGLGFVTLGVTVGRSEERSETLSRHVHLGVPLDDPGVAVRAASSII
jgi:hypothetical protein